MHGWLIAACAVAGAGVIGLAAVLLSGAVHDKPAVRPPPHAPRHSVAAGDDAWASLLDRPGADVQWAIWPSVWDPDTADQADQSSTKNPGGTAP